MCSETDDKHHPGFVIYLSLLSLRLSRLLAQDVAVHSRRRQRYLLPRAPIELFGKGCYVPLQRLPRPLYRSLCRPTTAGPAALLFIQSAPSRVSRGRRSYVIVMSFLRQALHRLFAEFSAVSHALRVRQGAIRSFHVCITGIPALARRYLRRTVSTMLPASRAYRQLCPAYLYQSTIRAGSAPSLPSDMHPM